MQAAEITGHVGTQHRGWRLKLQRQGLNDLAQESMAIAQLNDGRTASRKFCDRLWKKKQWAPRQSVDLHANARCKPRPAGVSELSATAARLLLASLMAPFLYLRVHVGWIAVCRGNSVQLRIQDITLGLESSNGLFLEISRIAIA